MEQNKSQKGMGGKYSESLAYAGLFATLSLVFALIGGAIYAALNVGNLTEIIMLCTGYVNVLSHGNEFLSGVILAAVFGGSAWFYHTLPSKIINYLRKHYTTTLSVDSTCEAYHQLILHLEGEGISDLARVVRFSNGRWDNGKLVKEVGFGSQLFWLRGRLISVHHLKDETSALRDLRRTLDITILGRSHQYFEKIMAQCESVEHERDMSKYYEQEIGHCRYITSQKPRSLDSIALSKANREALLHTIDNFVAKEAWYLEHNVPYQLGILLHGPPGTGKTSLIRGIAAYMGRNIVTAKSSNILEYACKTTPRSSLIVVEEIDTFGVSQRELDSEEDEDTNVKSKDYLEKSLDSFSVGAILSALDGLIPNPGRVLIMTTNHPDKIDKAITRPGRIDLSLYLGYLDQEVMGILLYKFFGEQVNVPPLRTGVSPAQVQNDIILGLTVESLIEKYKA